MKRQRVKFPGGTSTEKTKHYKLKRSTVSSIGGHLSPTSGIVNLVFSCQNGFLSASICSLIIKALVITESAVPSLLRPGFETVPPAKIMHYKFLLYDITETCTETFFTPSQEKITDSHFWIF